MRYKSQSRCEIGDRMFKLREKNSKISNRQQDTSEKGKLGAREGDGLGVGVGESKKERK